MAGSQVRIHGKGHLLCLSRILQASLEEESFADVRLIVFKPNILNTNSFNKENHPQYLRANRAVLAAASSIFAKILVDSTEDETTIVFEGYQFEDIANMLQYIYTGQASISCQREQIFKSLLEQMHIGSFTNSSNVCMPNHTQLKESSYSENKISHAQPISLTQKNNVTDNLLKVTDPVSLSKEKHNHGKCVRRLPIYPTRPLQLPKKEITIQDPLKDPQSETTHPDTLRSGSLLEKSSIKFDLLDEANAETVGSFFDYPRMADRLGIYFDPQLFNYYRSLVRSLPPIRIFLHIDEDELDSDAENIELAYLKKSDITYPSARRNTQQVYHKRKSFSSNRLPVQTMCSVNGKMHIILDGQPITIDPSIKPIDYPSLENDEECQLEHPQQEEENFAEQAIESEVRRKRILITTLNRLKKDHSRAKKVAQHILKASKKQDMDVFRGRTTVATKKMPRKNLLLF